MLLKIKMRYWDVSARLRYGVFANVKTAVFFLWLALVSLFGKYCVVNMREETSRGGYKYIAVILSKLPLSTGHTYEEFE